MEALKKLKRSKVLLPSIPIIILLAIIVNDLAIPYYYTPPAEACSDHVIIDVYGLLKNTTISKDPCYVKGMSVSDFRTLGKLHAKKIIILTHYFVGRKADGLGTSDRPALSVPLLHPISVFFLVKGTTQDGNVYLAVSPRMTSLADRLNGKTIIIITCSYESEEMATALLNIGAQRVIISNTPSLSKDKAYTLVLKAIMDSPTALCASNTFTCYGG